MLSAPSTLLTDYLLAAASAVFGWRLVHGHAGPRRTWGLAFFALALAALAGGSYHGTAPQLAPALPALLWQVTEAAIGIGMLLLLVALAGQYLEGRARRALVAFAALKFMAFAVAAALSDDFAIAVADSVATMAVVLVLGLRAARIWHHPSGRWLVAGVAASVAAAVVQQVGLAPHPHFNHNDLYHVIQIAGFYLLFRGGLGFALPVRKDTQ